MTDTREVSAGSLWFDDLWRLQLRRIKRGTAADPPRHYRVRVGYTSQLPILEKRIPASFWNDGFEANWNEQALPAPQADRPRGAAHPQVRPRVAARARRGPPHRHRQAVVRQPGRVDVVHAVGGRRPDAGGGSGRAAATRCSSWRGPSSRVCRPRSPSRLHNDEEGAVNAMRFDVRLLPDGPRQRARLLPGRRLEPARRVRLHDPRPQPGRDRRRHHRQPEGQR